MRNRKFFFIIIIFLIAIVIFSFIKTIKSNYFGIKEIDIRNNKIIKLSYLENSFKKLKEKNIFFIRKNKLLPNEIKILVENINLKRKFPNKLYITINEKFPLMYLNKEKKSLIDKNGYYISLSNTEMLNYEYLTHIKIKDTISYINTKIVMDKEFYIISNYLQEIRKINTNFFISSFYLEEGYIYLTDAQNKVQIKLKSDFKRSLQRYLFLKNEGYLEQNNQLIDFSINHQAIIK